MAAGAPPPAGPWPGSRRSMPSIILDRMSFDCASGAERNNLGFDVLQVDKDGKVLLRVNQQRIPGLLGSPVGEEYEVVDPAGKPGDRYLLRWYDHNGPTHEMGPGCGSCRDPAAIREAHRSRGDPRRERAEDRRPGAGPRCVRAACDSKPPQPARPGRSGADPRGAPRREAHGQAGRRLPNRHQGFGEAASAFIGKKPSEIALSQNGQPVPFWTSTKDALTADDSLTFYGLKRQDSFQVASAYQLAASATGKTILELAHATTPTGGNPVYAPFYTASLNAEQDKLYALTPKIDDNFYWDYVYPRGAGVERRAHRPAQPRSPRDDPSASGRGCDGVTDEGEVTPTPLPDAAERHPGQGV